MALTIREQELFDFALGSLPSWMRTNDEVLTAAAKVFGLVRTQIDYLFGQALITTATGPTSTTPDWLNQHARDRDTSRQGGEEDEPLQERLRVFPDALTRSAILAAANAILAAAGVVGEAQLLELPRDGAWAGDYTAMSGTGGAFTHSGSSTTFTPTVLPWPVPPWRSQSVFPVQRSRIVVSGAASAGNNGTYELTANNGNAAVYTNASGVAGADATVSWAVQRMDVDGNVTDGFARAYAGRGWRAARDRGRLIIILPFGTSAGDAASVLEAVRLKRAAGALVTVERRENP